MRRNRLQSIVVAFGLCAFLAPAVAQQLPKTARESAESMLKSITSDIRKNYYDPQLHGLAWDSLVASTKEKIDQSASFDIALAHIAAVVDALNDSHTYMVPPRTLVNDSRSYVRNWRALMPRPSVRYSYGFEYEIIGERCFVSQVRPGSDAEKKRLHAGDEILSINGYRPERETIERAKYVFNVLRPQLVLKLTTLSRAGVQSEINVDATIHKEPTVSFYEESTTAIQEYEKEEHLFRPRIAEFGENLIIIKLPEFFLRPDEVQELINKARNHKALILDLRGNPGGAEETLKNFVGGMMDHEVKIADRVMRSDRKPLIAKPLPNTFGGKLVVLIDSRSMSAAELFSRVMQLEKRGVVVGDQSGGRVMEAKYYGYQLFGSAIHYGASITVANLIMADGKSLEHVGVTPDEEMVAAPIALEHGWDPVLSHVAETLGVDISPQEAGKLFPHEWPPE